jgi:hypothetical protein
MVKLQLFFNFPKKRYLFSEFSSNLTLVRLARGFFFWKAPSIHFSTFYNNKSTPKSSSEDSLSEEPPVI